MTNTVREVAPNVTVHTHTDTIWHGAIIDSRLTDLSVEIGPAVGSQEDEGIIAEVTLGWAGFTVASPEALDAAGRTLLAAAIHLREQQTEARS